MKSIMKLPSGRPALILISIIVVIIALITAIMGIFFYGNISPGSQLAKSVQDEYSVPVNLMIVNVSGTSVAYIIPEEVRWEPGHKKLLYDLSNPKEAALGFVEALANKDEEALDLLVGKESKAEGKSPEQLFDVYTSTYTNMNEPYLFDLDPEENDPAGGRLLVKLIRNSGEISFELTKEDDGTWKI